ncbi:MAG: ATP phosphoribosyltransferase regulatory subunit [Proteobacteria bacterium]|nr:ATP phosphoribosyltransferase regulatory subunit [Pseudomonadota bacterium]
MLKIPDGFLDLSPEKAEVFYFVKKRLFDIVSLFGVSPIVTSSVEFSETYKLSGEGEEFFFSYIDPYEGKPACFRYDFTPQIARFLSGKDLTKGYKFYYDGSVLRNEKVLSGRMREIFQAGVELINFSGIEWDIYLIGLIKKILNELELKKSKIFLNDVNIFNRIVKKWVGDQAYEPLKSAFIKRDISLLEEIVFSLPVDKKKKDFIVNLPFFCGDRKLIDNIIKKYNFSEINDYLNKLKKIYEQTISINGGEVLFDLGEIKGFEYHTGLIFDVYSLDVNNNYLEIITGGRYDNLLKKYTGKDVPATGFAINLLNLTNVIGHLQNKKILLLSCLDSLNKAYEISKGLSDLGYRVDIVLKDDSLVEKDFDLMIEIYNNKILVSKKKDGKKLAIDGDIIYNKDLFEERLKELL